MVDLSKIKYDQESQDSDETVPIIQTKETKRLRVCTIVLYTVAFVVPISMIVYGTIHLTDCPAERMVAICLIVLGSLNVLLRVMITPQDFREASEFSRVQKYSTLTCLKEVLEIIIICWFFALCYLIFAMEPDTEPENLGATNYCDLEFYTVVFWGSVAGLSILGFIFVVVCGAACCIAR